MPSDSDRDAHPRELRASVMRPRSRGAIVGTVFALVLGVSACASSGSGGFGDGSGRRWARVITLEELDGLDAVDCYEAIQRQPLVQRLCLHYLVQRYIVMRAT